MADTPTPRVIYDVTGLLEAVTPLHVGSGKFRAISTVKGDDRSNRSPEVAAIVRDVGENPYIPGTTIKGLLRRIGLDQAGIDADWLFGSIKDEAGGAPGRATVFGARLSGSAPAVPDGPFVAGAETELGQGVFVSARTRIDPESGTAGAHALFHQEMVAPKARFRLRLRVDGRAGVDLGPLSDVERSLHGKHTECAVQASRNARQDADDALKALLKTLEPLCGQDGEPIGKGHADGLGRVRLIPDTLEISGRALGADGALRPHAPGPSWSPTPAADTGRRLRLVCDGPFLVVDASKKRKPGENPDGAQPHISAQAWGERLPMLLGPSLAGVLRARARWIAMRGALRHGADERAIRNIDPGDAHLRGEQEIEKLSSVQRLFGVTGFRGRLAITRLRVSQATPWDITAVKLDRFTGGPIDNALFKTHAFLGVTLDIGLAVEERPRSLSAAARKQDQDLFESLLADIRADGLMLGHGGNKGFGWFRNEELRP